jgi:hypothetical protein
VRINLRTDSTFVHAETLQGVQESWKPLKVSEKVKLRRVSAFTHKVVAARSAEATELLEEFIVFKAQEEQCIYTQVRTQSDGAHRKKNSRLRPLRIWKKKFQVLEESTEVQEVHNNHQI